MNHRKSSLSKLAAVASVLGLAACGSTNQSQASAPKSAQATPATPDQYGSATAQAGAGETATSTAAAQPSPSTMGTSETTSPGAMSGTTETSGNAQGGAEMGAMGAQSGSESGAMHGGNGGTRYSPSGTTGAMGATNAMGGSTDVSTLSDAQFAGVLQTMNQGRIQEALIGQEKGSSPGVKHFAREMVTSHRTVQNKERALFTRLQLTPADSALSNQLKSDTQNELSALQSMRGKDFDRSFMDSQVRHLNNALELVDRIVPDVKSSELKAELQGVRTKIDGHLKEAERIQQTLEQGTTNAQPGSNPN
jgi:putative membrane protein